MSKVMLRMHTCGCVHMRPRHAACLHIVLALQANRCRCIVCCTWSKGGCSGHQGHVHDCRATTTAAVFVLILTRRSIYRHVGGCVHKPVLHCVSPAVHPRAWHRCAPRWEPQGMEAAGGISSGTFTFVMTLGENRRRGERARGRD